jgi:NTP pyrophosphatase (non-canonical NTP hydrolase)
MANRTRSDNDFARLTELILKFREERDWKQFHTPKDMALSLMLESAEVAEHFQWKNSEEMEAHIKNRREDIGDELADVLFWVLIMGHDFKVDIEKAFIRKMKKNAKKYPAEKVRGKHLKYTEYTNQ